MEWQPFFTRISCLVQYRQEVKRCNLKKPKYEAYKVGLLDGE
jgi:hypothetical protein